MNQPMSTMPQQAPKAVRTWLLVILIVVILAAAGFIWYFYYGPGKSTPAATTPATTDVTADWKTYTDKVAGYTIKYPKDYTQTNPKTTVASFAPANQTGTAPLSIDAFKPVPVTTLDAYIESEKVNKGHSECVKTTLSKQTAYECLSLGTVTAYDILADNNGYRFSLLFNSGNKDTLAENKAALTTIQKNMLSTFKFTTPTAAATATDLTYDNATYGFTMTFPATWKGYKMKESDFEGVMTYYINMPTTEASAAGDTTADAGYFSPFAVSVYTLADWNTIESGDGPKATLITKNDQYAFAWSPANGVPPSDWKLGDDIKTIIASFKLK